MFVTLDPHTFKPVSGVMFKGRGSAGERRGRRSVCLGTNEQSPPAL